MENNYLITGYWGEPHVTVENDRSINVAMFGTGRFVLPVGRQFEANYIGSNIVRMYDGKLLDNGAAAGIPTGQYIDLLIENASQGMNRKDLIVFQYEKDSSTLVESGKFVVIQGTETSGTASIPALKSGDLLLEDTAFEQMALWCVSVSGVAISAPERMFTVAGNLESANEAAANALGAASEAMSAAEAAQNSAANAASHAQTAANNAEAAKSVANDAKAASNNHANNTQNPHGVTASQVGAVPTSRKINNKPLSGDISLTPSDIGLVTENWVFTLEDGSTVTKVVCVG